MYIRTTHSPSSVNHYLRRRNLEKMQKFDFDDPSETYGLIVQSSKNVYQSDSIHNSSMESILPVIKQKKANRSSSKDIFFDEPCVVLIGNTFKRLEKQIIKPKILYQPEIFIPLKRLKKPTQSRQKFNGIYYEDEKFSQDLEFQNKYANLRTYLNIMAISNNIFVVPTITTYKAYIGKGNNGQLVKQILKMRWWWQVIESDKESANFLWQQLRNNNYIQQLPISSSPKIIIEPTQNNILDFNQPYSKFLPQRIQQSIQGIYKKTGKQSKILNLESAQFQIKGLRIFEVNQQTKLHNHVQNNMHLGSKKWLYINMNKYYDKMNSNVFDYLPLTYLIKNKEDLDKFLRDNQNNAEIWIVKPGELTNRGHGIQICSQMKEIQSLLRGHHVHRNGSNKSFIVQKYIQKPLLYNQRKFDIRCYILFTSINGQQKGYWYQEGYIRTSSKEYNLKNLANRMIHLTNDAVQKNSDDYGKYEKGNKISFEEFSKWLSIDFNSIIYPQIKKIAEDQFNAVYGKMDPQRRENCFELFGLDYMIDEEYRVWLIETNTNPCLETTGPLLGRLIPQLIDNLFKLVLDPLYPPPTFYTPKRFVHENQDNKFELIFDGATMNINVSTAEIDDIY